MRTILLGLLLAAAAFGQSGTPDCQFTSAFTSSTTTSASFNNKVTRCVAWRFTYWTNGAASVSVTLQGAPDVAGVAGSFVALTPTQGTVNPAITTAEGTVVACCDYYPWINVNAGTFTGTAQTMAVTVYGWKAPDTGPTSTSGGGATGNVNVIQWGSANTTLGQKAMAASVPVAIASDQSAVPVTIAGNQNVNLAQVAGTNTVSGGVNGTQGVGGLAASGAAKAGNPNQIGGVFNTTQPTVTNGQAVEAQMTARGAQIVAPGVDGFAVTGSFTGNITAINGTTSYGCGSRATIAISGSGNTEIIPISGSTTIRICHISLATTPAENISITAGTGSNCAGSTATLAGPYISITAFALDFGPFSTLQGVASNAVCINQANAQATSGVVIYDQR